MVKNKIGQQYKKRVYTVTIQEVWGMGKVVHVKTSLKGIWELFLSGHFYVSGKRMEKIRPLAHYETFRKEFRKLDQLTVLFEPINGKPALLYLIQMFEL